MAVQSARIVLKDQARFEPEDGRIDKYTLADKLPAKMSELGLRPRTMATKPAYTIRTINNQDKEKVLDFLGRFFFRDEPMNTAVGLLETAESRCEELEEYAASTLDEGVSVAAVDENGDFIGIVINGLVKKEGTADGSKIEDCGNPKFRRILRVLAHLDREARIWDKLPEHCKTSLEIRIASTHSEWRGRGLMRDLCEETERIARRLNASILRMDATSAFSAAVAERLGYKRVYSVPYEALPEPDAPLPNAPHVAASVYIKIL